MFYHISCILTKYIPLFNVVHYISFRCAAALLSSLFFSFLFGNFFIAISQKLFRAQSRPFTPEIHKKKDNMPTMGGIFIIFIVIINTLLWCRLDIDFVWGALLTFIGFGIIGLWDDWQKIKYGNGISISTKFFLEIVVAFLASIFLYEINLSTTITMPFFKYIQPDIGLFFIPWVIFILVGTSNAVNLTDGLDGLAIGSLISNFATFSFICYLAGNLIFAHYLHIPFVYGIAEIAIVGATLVGASLGFLWYNAHPAQIFMGDVGSLALGGMLGYMAIIAKQELLLPVAGGLFVVEALSVLCQIFSYKLYGKRVLRMAPIHHHFELLGWPETKISVRFGIISLILCLVALMTLKIR